MNRKYITLIMTVVILASGCNRESNNKMQIDHIILATKNLDLGVKQFEMITGIRPKYGGGHPNGDTHNATIALSDDIYIEILAPKDHLDSIPEFFKEMNGLTPIGFAISVMDINQLEKDIRKLKFKTNGAEDWSRKKPSGETIQWKLLMVNEPQLIMNPFFIEWSEKSTHPSHQNNIEGNLKALELLTPQKNVITQTLTLNKSRLKKLQLIENNETKISFKLNTPKGIVTFK